MKSLSLKYQLPGPEWLFSVPSSDPLQNSGPLSPVFEDLLADLRRRKLPKALHLTLELPIKADRPGVVAALHEGWQRVTAARLRAEQQQLAELRFSRRRYLLKGLLVLGLFLGLNGLLANYDSQLMKTLAESLIIGGWVAVWVPMERILYTGLPMSREIAILQCLHDCNLQIQASAPDTNP